jgi:type IV secretion system protein VirB6
MGGSRMLCETGPSSLIHLREESGPDPGFCLAYCLGPIFILCLLLGQTKSLFQRWMLYGIGTMFSMAVLSAMVSIALKMVTAVAEAFWATALAGSLLGENFTDGMTSQAMQQGGMGLILKT